MNTPENMTLQATVDQDGSRGAKVDSQTWSDRFAWVARILILLALAAAPWMFGSYGFWSQFWISSALLISLALWWFDTALNKRNAQVLPYVSILLIIGVLIGLFQLMSLPGFLTELFVGRQAELFSEFAQGGDTEGSVSNLNRITLNANGTWHHIRLLVIAISALLLSCRYFRTPGDLTLLLTVMTVNGVALSLFGVVQKLTTDGTTLFWSISLELGGIPFGPYVNRNNAAGFLLICLGCAVGLMVMVMSVKKNPGPVPIISQEIPFWRQISQQLLYFISELTATKLATLLAVIFISMGIVASLSRGAVLGLLVAGVATVLSYGAARRPKNMSVVLLPLGIGVLCLAGWLGFGNDLVSRFDRLDSTVELEKMDARIQTWTDCWASVGEMGQLGSGLGTYENVSRLYRTDKETSQAFKFAENQYFQALVEAGWFGLAVFLTAWFLMFYCSYFLLKIGQSPGTVTTGVMGVFVFWSQAVACLFDFGWYLPANTLAMGCVTGAICYNAHSMAYRLKQKSFLRFQFPNSVVQVILVGIFAFSTVVTLDLNRKSRIEAIRTPNVSTPDSLAYDKVDARIRELSELASNTHSFEAMNELGKLFIYRTRLEMFDFLKQQLPAAVIDKDQAQRVWDATALYRLHERSEQERRRSKLSQQRFKRLESISLNLPSARHWLIESIRQNPLQPEVQITLGEITSIVDDIHRASPYLERSIMLAPSNAILLKQVAILYIQAGEFAKAAPHLKRFLDLEPHSFNLMMRLLTIQMNEDNDAVDHDLILNHVLPDRPLLLYKYASQYAEPDSLNQKIALEKGEVLLEKVSQSDPTVIILKARIRVAMGDNSTAAEYFKSALVNNPTDEKILMELIDVLMAEENYSEALIRAKELIRLNGKNRWYSNLYDSIKSKIEEQRNF